MLSPQSRFLVAALLVSSIGTLLHAAEPAVDRVGPLTARLDGPAVVSPRDVPLALRLQLENSSDERLPVSVRFRAIDGWAVRSASPERIEIGPRATQTLALEVEPGRPTYNALYPVHAFIAFEQKGEKREAHPVLLIKTEGFVKPRAVASERAEPYRVGPSGALALWELSSRGSFVQVEGQPSLRLESGVATDPSTGGSVDVRPQTIGGRRFDVVAIHPPWRDGRVGVAFAEFPLVLPAVRPIALKVGAAVVDDGHGDGVSFRIRVATADAAQGTPGALVAERHVTARTRVEALTVDLSQFAGRSIRLQLESHPGPRKDTGWDMSFWVEPTLEVGKPAPEMSFPPTDRAGSESLGLVRTGNAPGEVRVWPGGRGLLDTVVELETRSGRLAFRGFEVTVGGTRLDDARSPVTLREARIERSPGIYRVLHRFEGPRGAFLLVGTLSTTDSVLRAQWSLESRPGVEPWSVVSLDDVGIGRWSRRARQVYAGVGNVVRDPGPFTLPFDGHRLATSFVGLDFDQGPSVVMGVDLPPDRFEVDPARQRYSLHAPHNVTLTLCPAPDVFTAVSTWHSLDRRPAGPGVPALAGRFVFDLWGGHYAETERALRRSFRHGLGESLVVWHNWQRWGYDYRLPDITPPNPELGTVDEMRSLINTCREAGTLFALHDNYIDAYPDADGFSYRDLIAFHADGTPVKAWFNEGRQAQSYRERPDRIEPFVARNLGWIRRVLGPTAYFVDVWSSIGPYDFWTSDGQFHERSRTRDLWAARFRQIRDTLGGDTPTLSESGHDQLIGTLDGAQTNHLRVGPPIPDHRDGWTIWNWPCADAERTPWIDVAYHDRFILHGAGYSNRYEGGLGPRDHGIDSDDYLCTEVLTGHPGMVARPFGYDVVRKHWLTNDLMHALARRRIERVEYVGGDLHRQHVQWSGGAEVWVNRGDHDWQVDGRTLPPFGFVAKAPTSAGPVESALIQRDGRLVEIASAPGRLFVNARGQADSAAPIQPVARAFRRVGGHEIRVEVEWHVTGPIPSGYRPFAHLCDGSGAIRAHLQVDPANLEGLKPRQGVVSTTVRGVLPSNVRPGEALDLRVGLFDPVRGPRLRIRGQNDGESRIILGDLRLTEPRQNSTDLSFSVRKSSDERRLERRNPDAQFVDFEFAVTSGGVRIERQDRSLVVTLLPDDQQRPLLIRIRPDRLPWPVPSLVTVERVAENGRVLSTEPIAAPAQEIVLTGRGGEFQYRLLDH